MAYKITIQEVKPEEYLNKNYVGKDADGADEYGYRYYKATRTAEKQVYQQTVDDLDVEDVIKAVNGL